MLAGFLIFALGGAGAVYLGTRDSGTSVSTSGQVEVLYAAAPLDVGTAGSTGLPDGRIETKRRATRPADAVTGASDISGRVAAVSVPAGTVITTTMFPAPQTR